MTFKSNEEFQQKIIGMADRHAERTKQELKLDYDFTPESLQRVDQGLAHFHPEGFSFDLTLHAYAAYVGETVRRNHGGNWQKEDDGTGASLRGIEGTATIYPFVWMADRMEALQSGSGGNEISDSYAALLESIGLSKHIPKPIPADYIKTLPPTELWSSRDSKSCSDSPASANSQPPQEKKELTSEQKQEALIMAPVSCFYLVAGIDGNIDKKEIKAFMNSLKKRATDENKLVSTIFLLAATRLDSDIKSLAEQKGGAMIMIPVSLMQARKAAEEDYPQDARGFCEVLLDMSTKIASASGGFLGFGNKIGKEEQAALNLIETVLLSDNSKE